MSWILTIGATSQEAAERYASALLQRCGVDQAPRSSRGTQGHGSSKSPSTRPRASSQTTRVGASFAMSSAVSAEQWCPGVSQNPNKRSSSPFCRIEPVLPDQAHATVLRRKDRVQQIVPGIGALIGLGDGLGDIGRVQLRLV